ncbi:hypothetical protein ACE106_19125 [Shouchella clausii]|uniref:hypothetical protein n=1 Tax=Shouchella clausii TaxID=79880 RepID=UPI001BB35576|nr:hypothetical protein [Shouchella clausii]
MMKRSFAFLFMIFILTACSQGSVEVPETDHPYTIISHAKEPVLSFVDLETGDVLREETVNHSLSYMAQLNDQQILGTNQIEEDVFLFDLENKTIRPFVTIGQGLTKIEVDRQTKRVFISDTKQNVVHVVDGKTGTMIKTLEVGDYPSDLLIDNKKQRLFVLSKEAKEVAIIDLVNLATVNQFPIKDNSSGLYYDGRHLWIGGHGAIGELNSYVQAYDPDTGFVMKEIEAGLMPIGIEADSSQLHLFFLSHGDHTLKKYNVEEQRIVGSVEVGQNPNYIAVFEDNVWVTNLDSDSLSIVDVVTMSIVKEIPISKGPYAIIGQFNE